MNTVCNASNPPLLSTLMPTLLGSFEPSYKMAARMVSTVLILTILWKIAGLWTGYCTLVTNFWQKFYVILCQRIIVTYSKYCWRDLIWIATQQDFIHSIKDLEWASCLHNSETDSVSVSIIRYRSLIGSIGLFNTKEPKPSS